MSREQRAIEAVKAVTPDGSKFKATGIIDSVLDGTLVFVEFAHDVDVWNEKYALFRGENVQVIANSQELATMVSHWSTQPMVVRILRLLAEPGIMSAAISLLIIVGALSFMLVARTPAPPPFLATAFTAVLAFYVGTRSAKA